MCKTEPTGSRKRKESSHDQENVDHIESVEVNEPSSSSSSISSLVEPTMSQNPGESLMRQFPSSAATPVTQKTPPKKQPRLDVTWTKQTSFQSGTKAIEVNRKLVYMLAKDLLPFRTVEKQGFQEFGKSLNPFYKIPNRKQITQQLEDKYECLSTMIKERLSSTDCLCLTTDVWTDPLNVKSYLGVTTHYLSGDKSKSVTIGVFELNDRHTSENLKTWLLDIVDKWRIDKDKIISVISDNAANIKKAICDGFGDEKNLLCFAHTLNLVPSKIIESDEVISPVVRKVKSIVTYFKKSVSAADQLRLHSELKLIQSVETRWNSTFEMLNRFIELTGKISSILLQCPGSPPMLTATELQAIREFVDLLRPFQEATNIVCGESYVTASKIISVVNTLRNKLEMSDPITEIGVRLKRNLSEQFLKRFRYIEQIPLIAIATLLDPRFKKIHFHDRVACSRAVDRISKSLQNSVSEGCSNSKLLNVNSLDISREDFWAYHEELVNLNNSSQPEKNQMSDDLKYYLHQPNIPMTDNPIKYWNSVVHSPISRLAKKYLSVVATSVPSERLFSKAGRILTQDRSRLSSKHLHQLLFLASLEKEDWLFD